MLPPDTIPEGIPGRLMAIGDLGRLSEDDRAVFARFDWINRLGRKEWESLSDALSEADLERLFRGLVISEKELDWLGGSVAAAV